MGFSKLKLIKSAFIGALALLLSVFAAPGAPLAEKIAVGALRFTSHAASFVAFERGYFTEQGAGGGVQVLPGGATDGRGHCLGGFGFRRHGH